MPESYPLTNFEELMLHQDSSAYPTTCFVRLRFQGQLQENAFRTAALTTIRRHPLLRATCHRNRGKYLWQVEDAAPQITWSTTSNTELSQFRRLDLQVEHGLRFAVHAGTDESEVMVQFHHACCDGLAIFQVLHELLLVYTNQVTDAANYSLPELDNRLLAKRGSFGLTTFEFLRMLSRQAVGLLGVWQFLVRRSEHLVAHTPVERESPTPSVLPTVVAHHFDKATSAAVRRAAKQAQVTLNDLLLSELFPTLFEFRKSQRANNPEGWLRLMIPVSLRQKHQYKASAANIVSSVFLDRRSIDVENPDQLLKGLSEEMNLIKRLKLNYMFAYSLCLQRLLPRGLKRTARPTQCQTTAVFTNLSRVFARSRLPRNEGRLQCGNVVLDHAEAIAPIARHMNAAFGVSSYAKRLTVSLNYDARVISGLAAEELLNGFVKRIQRQADSDHTPGV